MTLTAVEARYELPDADPDTTVELWHHGEHIHLTGGSATTRPTPPIPAPAPVPHSPRRPQMKGRAPS
ncbi:hypothetical protein AB0873_16355 [Micromonospora sp. NPDC047707]|uniref:hypothetical protein n=1 Tax=Micromonospora sp. NPDC047707 TaxID=3154498 RepID=UPI0034521D11